MTVPVISLKSFVKAMALPDDQRRKKLESLGAKMMDKIRSEQEAPRRPTLRGDLARKQA